MLSCPCNSSGSDVKKSLLVALSLLPSSEGLSLLLGLVGWAGGEFLGLGLSFPDLSLNDLSLWFGQWTLS